MKINSKIHLEQPPPPGVHRQRLDNADDTRSTKIGRYCRSTKSRPTKIDRHKSADFSMTHDRFLSPDTVGRQYRPVFVDRVSWAVVVKSSKAP